MGGMAVGRPASVVVGHRVARDGGKAVPAAALPCGHPRSRLRPRRLPLRWAGHGRGFGSPDGTTSAHLVHEAWRPGVHLLRLPPVYSATEVVLGGGGARPVLSWSCRRRRGRRRVRRLAEKGRRVALLPEDWPAPGPAPEVVIGTRAAAWRPAPGSPRLSSSTPMTRGWYRRRHPPGTPVGLGGPGRASRRAVLLGYPMPEPGAGGRGRRYPYRQPGQ